MSRGAMLGVFAGGVLALALFGHFGIHDVTLALSSVGWSGLAWITVAHLPSLVLAALAWRLLAVGARAPAFGAFVCARWIRGAAGNVMAMVPLAGEAVGQRVLAAFGLAPRTATATVVVDMTVEMASQIAFGVLGLALIAFVSSATPGAVWAPLGLLLMLPLLGGLIAAQGTFGESVAAWLARHLGGRAGRSLLRAVRSWRERISELYRRRGVVGAAFVLHFGAWVVGTAEAWLALRLLGSPLAVWQVVALESLVFALRSAAFFVPAALGVQEGGYVVLGAAFGLAPETALALSLVKRAREWLMAIPGLLAWQYIERRQRETWDSAGTVTPKTYEWVVDCPTRSASPDDADSHS